MRLIPSPEAEAKERADEARAIERAEYAAAERRQELEQVTAADAARRRESRIPVAGVMPSGAS